MGRAEIALVGVALRRRSGFLRDFAKADVLLIDDLTIGSPTEQVKRDLPEILDDRYDRKSTIVTTQLGLESWHCCEPIARAECGSSVAPERFCMLVSTKTSVLFLSATKSFFSNEKVLAIVLLEEREVSLPAKGSLQITRKSLSVR